MPDVAGVDFSSVGRAIFFMLWGFGGVQANRS